MMKRQIIKKGSRLSRQVFMGGLIFLIVASSSYKPLSAGNSFKGSNVSRLSRTGFHGVLVSNAVEIAQAMTKARPGDTLIMTPGIWMDQHIIFEGAGTDQASIVLKAEIPGKTILSGNSSISIAGCHLIVDGLLFRSGGSKNDVIAFRNGHHLAENCRLTNTVIEDYNASISKDENKWISLYGSRNRVDHCYFKGKINAGATLVVWLDGTPAYHRIDHNYFGPRPPLGMNGGETIRIGTSTWSLTDAFTTVEDNYFEKCNGEIEIISNKSGHNIYRHNTFYACEGTLTLRHGNYALVEGNFFFGGNQKDAGGIRIIGNHHVVINNYLQDITGTSLKAAISLMNTQEQPALSGYSPVDSILIANNTIINCREGIVIGSGAGQRGRTRAPDHCLFLNNLICSKNGRLIRFETSPTHSEFRANIVYGKKQEMRLPEGVVFENPKLVLTDDGKSIPLWRPEPNGSTIKDKGVPLPHIPFVDAVLGKAERSTIKDMDQQTKNDGLLDVGADEQLAGLTVVLPASAKTTGPDWMQHK